jgi:alpha-L-rhamnosidase/Glycosyl hydrolases family 2, sugar binding domain
MQSFSRRQFLLIAGGAIHGFRLRSQFLTTMIPAFASPEDLERTFNVPPGSARAYVLWMWMGSNISRTGITRDLEAMKEAGIGGATIMSLADTTTPWAGAILKSPTPEIVAFTDPWWELLRHAAAEARRLELELILHNCAGYESSGGKWITPELSMQEIIWSELKLSGGTKYRGVLERAQVDPHPHARFPDVFIPSLARVDKPIVEGRKTFYRDIAVLAVPAEGLVSADQVLDVSEHVSKNGEVEWNAPAGDWILYRFGHTTTGAMIQPAQWDAMGLECDKMSTEAVTFHVRHVLTALEAHLGELAGSGITTLYFDSYEAGDPTWTPKMREEFQSRRGYSITPWLPVLTGRTIGSEAETGKFKQDFKRTVQDLYRDCYWATASRLAHEAGLKFGAEPYEGPWEISEVVKFLDQPTGEFWTHDDRYSPQSVEPVVQASHALKINVVAAEAFTSHPKKSRWTEHPAWLKPIGDAAFCDGINRLAMHHFVQQPWGDEYKPGNVMGQWGIHFGRNQTWWKPGQAWLKYLWRCQALLQRGEWVDSIVSFASPQSGQTVKSIHRRDGNSDIFFVANTSWIEGKVECEFPVQGRVPELWDPVWNTMRDLSEFEQKNGHTMVPIEFAPTQSFFVIFRKPASGNSDRRPNFPILSPQAEIDIPWNVTFDPKWGGPGTVRFDHLEDWTTRPEPGIRYFSGTAVYHTYVTVPKVAAGKRMHLDLGTVRNLAEVTINGKNLGVVWTAPWRVDVTPAIKPGNNEVEVKITNVWANRLIGDEQQPADCIFSPGDPAFNAGSFLKEFPDWFLKGEPRPARERYTFTTWNYFTKESPLVSSGLLGPLRFVIET